MPHRPKLYGSKHRGRKRKTAHQRGYGYRWRKLSSAYLEAHPLCRECERQGRTTAADCVDHIIPHRGDRRLFWLRTNWQPLCNQCHGIKTRRGE